MFRNISTAVLLLVLWSCCADWSFGQAKDDSRFESNRGTQKRIRKLLVPEADVDEFVEQRRGYLAMNRAEFEKLLGQHEKHLQLNHPAFIAKTVLNGGLEANGELSGQVFLFIENPSETAEFMSINGLNMFLFDAAWLDEQAVSRLETSGYQSAPAANNADQPDTNVGDESEEGGTELSAVIGNDTEGTLKILVNKTGVLSLRWKYPGLSPVEKGQRKLSLPITLPPSVNSLVYLKMPARYSLQAAGCKVELVPGAASSADANAEVASAGQEWLINCGAKPDLRIELEDREQQTEPLDETVSDETVVYNVQPEGIEFESIINLENLKVAGSQLQFKVPLDAVCTGIQLAGEALPYTVEQTGENRLITLNLVTTELETSSVRLLGYSPLPPGQMTQLPRVQLENIQWRHSEIRVVVSSLLDLLEFNIAGVVAKEFGDVEAANDDRETVNGDRAYQFNAFDKNFQINLACKPRTSSLAVTSICKADIGLESIEASQTSILRCRQGNIFAIEADYPAYWIIDSIAAADVDEAISAEKLVSYWESRDTNSEVQKKLYIQFSRPIDATHAMVLKVKGHRTFASNVDAQLEEFNMLSFETAIGPAEAYTKTVSLNTKAKTRLKLTENDAFLKRVAMNELDASLVQHAAITERDVVLLLNRSEIGSARVVIEKESEQQFEVDVLVTGFISAHQVREEMRIDCRPTASEVSRLEISLLGTESPVQWHLGESTSGRLVARQLESRNVETESGLKMEQVWEVELRPPMTEPFALHGTLISDRQGSHSIKRLNVRNALNQSQRTLLGTIGAARAVVGAGDFESVPWQPRDRELFSALLGAYRPISANTSLLVVKDPEMEPIVSGWVDHLHVDYRFDGRSSESVARLFLNNHGMDSFDFRLPPESVMQSVHVDGSLAEFAKTEDGGFSCRLPVDQEDTIVTLLYTSEQRPVGLSKRLPLPAPDINLPILDQRQTIFLGDGWALTDNWQPVGYQPTFAEEVHDRLCGGLTPFVFSKASSRSSSSFANDGDNRVLQFGTNEAAVDKGSERTAIRELPRVGFAGDERVVEVRDASSPKYILVNVRWIEIASWLALLSSFCIAMSIGKRRRKLLFFVAILAAATCLVVPLVFAQLFAAVFWGNMLSLLMVSLRIKDADAKHNTIISEVRAADHRNGLTATLSVWTCTFLFLQNQVIAVDEPAAKQPRIMYYDVILPVDKDDQPSGDVVYVPRELYSSMITDKSLYKPLTLPVMFASAEYQCEMRSDEAGSEISVKEIVATISFRTSPEVKSVLIPIDTKSILLTPDSVRLDGIQTSIRLSDEGSGFFVEAERPGQHTLIFRFLPKTTTVENWQELNLSVPRIHESLLTISLPRQINSLNITSQICVLRQDRASRNYQAGFGPAGRLSFRWPQDLAIEKESPVTFVDQLLKTEFKPDGAYYEYLWLLKNRESSSTDVLEIEIDGDLKLLDDESSRVLVKNAAGNKRNRFVFESTQKKDIFFVSAKFRDQAGSVLGNHYLPRVTIPSARIDANLVSLLADKSLELKVLADPKDVLADSVGTFVQLWSRARVVDHSQIKQVVRIDDAKPRWPVAVWPKEAEYQAQSALQLSIGPDRATFDATIEVRALTGVPSFVEFALPAGFAMRSVNVAGIDDQQMLKLIESNRCKLNLDTRGRTALQIRIQGDIAVHDQIPFPTLQVLNCQPHVQRVSIVRGYNQDTSVSPPLGYDATVEQSELNYDNWLYRFDSSWTGSGEIPAEGQGQVRVAKAELADHGSLVTTLKKEGPEFVVDYDCLLQGSDGSRLDAIRLNVSDGIDEILSASVPGRFRLTELPLTTAKRIEFIPDQTLVPYSRVTIRAKLLPRRSLPPHVFWTNFADESQQFVRLPKEVDGITVEWSISELASIKSETFLKQVEKLPAAKNYENFQVLRSDYQAVMAVNASQKRELNIPLQVTNISWSGDNYLIGNCEIELSASDATAFYLDHHANISVIDATVDGLPVEFSASEGFCRVNLPASRFPRSLSIAFQSHILAMRDSSNFEFGVLVPRNHEVGTDLFQIILPTSLRNLFRAPSIEGLRPNDFAVSRMEAIAGLANTLPIQSAGQAEVDRGDWLTGWHARMLAMTQQVDATSMSMDIRSRYEKVLQTTHEDSLGLPGGAGSQSISVTQDSAGSQTISRHDDYSVWHGKILNRSESVRLSFNRMQRSNMRLPSQVSIAVALLLGCIVILVTPVWGWLGRVAQPIGLVATALLGLSWTIFFSPAFVGWLIVLAALCIGVRSMLSRRQPRAVAVRDDSLLASQ